MNRDPIVANSPMLPPTGSTAARGYIYLIEDYLVTTERDGTDDATTAFQALLDEIETDMKANDGGTYVIETGNAIIKIDGALQTTGSVFNTQLKLPQLALGTDPQCTLVIRGAGPVSSQFAVVGVSLPTPSKGAMIKSTLVTGGGTQPSVIGGHNTGSTFSLLSLVLENIEIRTIENPLISGVDAGLIAAFEMREASVNVGEYKVDDITTPTTTSSVGVIAPIVSNSTYSNFDNAYVCGFYTGYRLNEHTKGTLCAFGNLVGIETTASFYGVHLDNYHDFCNGTGIKAVGGATKLVIDCWEIERAQSGGFARSVDVSDASAYLTGRANYMVVLGGTGIVTTFSKTGGGLFDCRLIGALAETKALSTNATASLGVSNASSGSSASARHVVTNNNSKYGALIALSSAYSVTNFQDAAGAVSNGKLVFIADFDTSSGGSSPIQFYTGGYSNNPTLSISAGNPGRITATGNFVDTVTVNNTSSSSKAFFKLLNDTSQDGGMGMYGSAFGVTAWQNNLVLGSNNGIVFDTNWNAGSGGTGAISFVAGGFGIQPTFIVGPGDPGNVAVATSISTSTRLNILASTSGVSSLRVPHGTAPSSPVNGDIWTTTAGLYVRINGATVGPLS